MAQHLSAEKARKVVVEASQDLFSEEPEFTTFRIMSVIPETRFLVDEKYRVRGEVQLYPEEIERFKLPQQFSLMTVEEMHEYQVVQRQIERAKRLSKKTTE